MDARQIIGWNRRRPRVAKGLTQERLALAADLDRAYVGRIKRGSESVTVTTLEMLASALSLRITGKTRSSVLARDDKTSTAFGVSGIVRG
jgi:transcriptional regulator with XRE-family HTH domain